MPSIFISGIPKGLDRTTASLCIRKDIERVAQVRTIGIQKDKGYGHVSLFDESSADFVLSLNEKIFINGKALRITKWRNTDRLSNIPRQTNPPVCKQHVNNEVFVFRGYDTYKSYKKHQPRNDVLYHHIQMSPKKKKHKRKPWKDVNRLSQVPSPKSTATRTRRRTYKRKGRRKKAEQLTFSSNAKGQERRNLTALCNEDNSLEELTHINKAENTSRSNTETTENTITKSQNQSATVHVYDHAKRLFSIEVDNDRVLDSIHHGLRSKKRWPSDDTILISHAGKIISGERQPQMANGDNIHIAVKGRGGMKEGDPPNEKEMLDTIEKNDNESSKKEELVGPLEQCDDTQEHIDISEETHQGYLTGEDQEKTCNQSGTEMDKNDTQEEKQGDIIMGDDNENSKEKNMPVNSTDTDPSDEYKQGDPLNEEGLVDHSDEHKQGDPAHEGGLVDPPDECNQCESANKVDQGDPLDEYKEGGPAHQKDQRDIPDAYKQEDHVIEEGLAESPDGYKQSELANKGKVDPSDEHKQDDPTPEEGLVDHSDECNQSETAHKEDQDDPPDKYKQGDSATEKGRIDPPHDYTEGSPAHQMDQGDIPDAFKQDDYVHEEGQVNPPDEYQQGNHAHEESQTDTLNECKQGDTVNEEGHVDPDSEYKKANHDHKEGLVDPSDGYTQRELVKKEDQADPNDEYKQGDHDRREGPVDPTGDDRPTYPDGHNTAKVKISSPLKSTFAQGSEVSQARLIAELGLEDHFPDKLTYTDVMSINDHEKEEADTLEDIPRLILRKLIMLDFTSRENDLDKCLTKMSRSNEKSLLTEGTSTTSNTDFQSLFDCDDDTEDEPSTVTVMYNPLDIFLSIFVCLNPTLKQKVCLKMFACHLAIPLIFPVPKNKDHEKVLMFSMWPLRSITVHDGKTETSVVNCKQNVVSFIRLGRPPISKSKLANELLYDTVHHSFFNYDCTLGSSDKQASLGLVEASWFLPSPKQHSTFESVTMFLNLRGDAIYNSEQTEYLKRVSRVMVVVTDIATMTNLKVLDFLKVANLNVLFLITGNLPNKNFIKKYKEYYMKSCPECFSAEFIPISDKGKNISLSEIKKATLNKMGTLLCDMSTRKTLHDMCTHARIMGLFVDEDLPACKRGIELANTIYDEIRHCDLADIKSKFSPLQKECWKIYTDAMKEFCNPRYDLREKDQLKQKMVSQRTQQWCAYINGDPFMKQVIGIIFELDDDELVCFLDTLKFNLDEKSRTEIPFYRQRFAEAWDTLQTKSDSDKAQTRKNFDKAEQHLSEASFGIEHIFREMGQIYVASLTSKDKEFGFNLAKAVARSITLGYPFELMDGDVANVPLEWIDGVFKELKSMLNNERVLSLSILGLQSSGKSTLLNAMFGLTFSVSAGRCTRGIYLQLLPVQKEGLNFNYVLVVDTEGLRAPELSNQKFQHDNELATLVLGMADITLINIKGENTSEVKDILQICVHAFLRLQMANQTLKLRQSCVFIHQNVSDVGAKDSMMHARKKLDETLDSITVEAAEEENISNITAFKDVINFDSNRHVWYFSDLWKGDPPMAPANTGYSRDVQEVKLSIFDALAKQRSSYLTISDTFVHIKDLWNGILANDFVFSFRNSLEIKAYNALESIYQDLIWQLERYKKTLENSARDKMLANAALCTTDKDKDHQHIQFSKIQNEYQNSFGDKANVLKKSLEKYFTESEKRDDIAKWKHVKLSSWDLFAAECLSKLKKQFVEMQSHCIADYEMKTCLENLKKGIYRKATDLAEKMKGDRPSEEDMEKSFDVMWGDWISGIHVPDEESIDIQVLLESISYDFFHTIRDIVDTQIKRHPLDSCKSIQPLENSLNDIKVDKTYISTKISVKGVVSYFIDDVPQKVVQFTNIILRDIDTRLEEMRKKDWKFDETEMKEFPKCILEHIDKFNHDTKNGFTLLGPYKVRLVVHVFGRALPLLKKLDSEYRAKHSMKTKLNNHKKAVWDHFRDVVAERSATMIASNRFCEVIIDQVEDKVRSQLPDSIYEKIVVGFAQSKHELMVRILTDLANEHNFYLFISYINDPYNYAFNWLKKLIDKECVDKKLYANNALQKLQQMLSVILDTMANISSTSLHEWLVDFQSEAKETIFIQMESFFAVEDQPITDLNDFITTVKDRLEQVHDELKDKFKDEGNKAIDWIGDKTPYEMCMDRLWGCRATCPFCHEPCQWNIDHDSDHLCIQHRAEGVAGQWWKDTRKLVFESCSFNVNHTTEFGCTDDGIYECDKHDKSLHYHPCRQYKKYIPRWDIPPCNDISSSLYWAWVLCTFNEDFAKYYGKVKADVPDSWKAISKKEAIKSLTIPKGDK